MADANSMLCFTFSGISLFIIVSFQSLYRSANFDVIAMITCILLNRMAERP